MNTGSRLKKAMMTYWEPSFRRMVYDTYGVGIFGCHAIRFRIMSGITTPLINIKTTEIDYDFLVENTGTRYLVVILVSDGQEIGFWEWAK